MIIKFSPTGVASVRGIYQGIYFLGEGDRDEK